MNSRSLWKFFAIVWIGAITCWACNDNRVYDHYESVDNKGWDNEDTLYFNVPRQWEGTYNMSVGLRSTMDFPFRSISLVIETSSYPKNIRRNDTIRCDINDVRGRMIGQQGVSSNGNTYPIAQIRLHRGDSLHIAVYHCMLRNDIPGICNVGIKLEKQ